VTLAIAGSVGSVGARDPYAHERSRHVVRFERRSAAPIYRVPVSIASDGSRDVTQELINFIAKVPDGSEIIFRKNGHYRIDGSLIVEGRSGLKLDGNAATLFSGAPGDRERSHLWLRGGRDLTVTNLTIRGSHADTGGEPGMYSYDYEGQHGIRIMGVDGVVVDKVRIYNVYGDAVWIGVGYDYWGDSDRLSTNVRITNSHLDVAGRHGICPCGVLGALIKGNRIENDGFSLIDIEPVPGWTVQDVRIVNNRFGDRRLTFISAAGEGQVLDIYVGRNTIEGRFEATLGSWEASAGKHARFVFEGNESYADAGSPHGALWLRNVHNVKISDNKIPFYAPLERPAVELIGSSLVRVIRNEFAGVGRYIKADSTSRNYKARKNTGKV
jgi:hypothetical protein